MLESNRLLTSKEYKMKLIDRVISVTIGLLLAAVTVFAVWEVAVIIQEVCK